MAIETMTEEEFEQLKPKLEKIIRDWWDEEQSSWEEEKPEESPEEDDIWSSVPKLDSKTAIKVSPEIEEKADIKVSEEMIKKGGYESIDELIEDLLDKIKNAYVHEAEEVKQASN